MKRERSWISVIVLAVAVVVASITQWPARAVADAPRTISHQGYITDQNGKPVHTLPGTISMRFAIYNVPDGGTALWSQTLDVALDMGRYNAILGPFPTTLIFDEPYYLGIAVGQDPEMIPRQPFTSVAYALNLGSQAPLESLLEPIQPVLAAFALGSVRIEGLQGESVTNCSLKEFELYGLSLGVQRKLSSAGGGFISTTVFSHLVLSLVNSQYVGSVFQSFAQGDVIKEVVVSLYEHNPENNPCIPMLKLTHATIRRITNRQSTDSAKPFLDVAFDFQRIEFEWNTKTSQNESQYDLLQQTGFSCPLIDPLIFVVSPPAGFPFEHDEFLAKSFAFNVQREASGEMDKRVQVRAGFFPESPCFFGHTALGIQKKTVGIDYYSSDQPGDPRILVQRFTLEDAVISKFQIYSLSQGGLEQVLDFSFKVIDVDTPAPPP